MIDPYAVIDPGRHIARSADVPRPSAQSPHGAATIDVFGLDRDRRRSVLNDATFAVDQAEQKPSGSPGRAAMRAVFLRYLDDSAEYAAMLRANLGRRIHAL